MRNYERKSRPYCGVGPYDYTYFDSATHDPSYVCMFLVLKSKTRDVTRFFAAVALDASSSAVPICRAVHSGSGAVRVRTK